MARWPGAVASRGGDLFCRRQLWGTGASKVASHLVAGRYLLGSILKFIIISRMAESLTDDIGVGDGVDGVLRVL